jgi:AAA+ superfamily predicted ATPase
MAYQMKAARFPAHRDLVGFEFEQTHVDEALVKQLHDLQFIDTAQNVVFVGGPGTGKTHLATSLGIQAVRAKGQRVRFFSTVELVNALELEKSQSKHGQLAHRLMYVDLVESPRILRRLKSLRGLSHEEIKQVFTRGSGTRSAHGAGAPRRVPFAVGGH